jgi:hypothetical protein
VKVQMKNRWTGLRANVEHRTVTVFDATPPSEFGGHQVKPSDEFGIFDLRFVQARYVLLGNDEHVRGRLGINVFKGESMRVFVDFLGGDLAFNDFAE